MLKILFLSYLFALWVWNARTQASQEASFFGPDSDPIQKESFPIH